MTPLSQAADRYLQIRRGLGVRLIGADGILRSFTDFAERCGATHITTQLVLAWVQQQRGVAQATRAERFRLVRHFALWHRASEPRTEVPPQGLVPGRYRRQPPYIYRDAEIDAVLHAARGLAPPTALKGHTYATVFALLWVTGMRVSEVVALDRDDAVLGKDMILQIRHTKFDKSRLLPLHPSTRQALAQYAHRRDRLIRRPQDQAFFLSDRGTRLTVCSLQYNFAHISQCVGLRAPASGHRHGRGPRLHDLRHHFVVQTLLDWYRAGVDVERQMPKLSAYVGHAHVNDTYWYIEAVPELLALAAARLGAFDQEAVP